MVGLENGHICKISPKLASLRYIAGNAEEEEDPSSRHDHRKTREHIAVDSQLERQTQKCTVSLKITASHIA